MLCVGLNCGSGVGRTPRSAHVVVPWVSVGRGWCSGTVAVVWLKWAWIDILEMNSSVASLLSGGRPLGMKMKYGLLSSVSSTDCPWRALVEVGGGT